MEVLAPLTRGLLERYFKDGPGRDVFYLGGGSALALAEFQHRRSDDLDLFSRDPNAVLRVGDEFASWGATRGLVVEEDLTRRGDRFRRLFFAHAEGIAKMDIIADSPPFFGPVRDLTGFRCEDRRTLFASKLGTLISRDEVRDLVDAYFIFRHSGQDRAGLIQDAMDKTGGLDPLDIAHRLLSFGSQAAIGAFLKEYMVRPVSADELSEFCRTEGEVIKAMAW